jgi:hypothetical protein
MSNGTQEVLEGYESTKSDIDIFEDQSLGAQFPLFFSQHNFACVWVCILFSNFLPHHHSPLITNLPLLQFFILLPFYYCYSI